MEKIFLFFLFFCFSVNAQNKPDVNTEYNKKYKKNITTKKGILTQDEFIILKYSLSKELQINLEENDAIVIHYFQYGKNCILADYNNEDVLNILNNMYQISSSTEKRFNLKNYYVYNSNSFFDSILSQERTFILDSGFFKDSIFTEEKNCNAFYLLKNNREYMLYYGSDYNDEIENFLTK
nr:hypothetical protein [uncultured Flavobacterium sp.]